MAPRSLFKDCIEKLQQQADDNDKATEQRVAQHLTFLKSNSLVFAPASASDRKLIPNLPWNQIRLGPRIAMGKFGVVNEVHISLRDTSTATTTNRNSSSNHMLVEEYVVHSNTQHAVKRVRKDLYAKQNEQASIDLAQEVEILSCLQHDHIVAIRATMGVPGHLDYGVVMDRLGPTLSEWMHATNEESPLSFDARDNFGLSSLNGFVPPSQHPRLLLQALQEMANALQYLHSKSIVYRDLKPENVATRTSRTSISFMLLDFGLAKELKSIHRISGDNFKATGLTGTLRIMAPEVVVSKPYGLAADIYSFGIFTWELASSSIAYSASTVSPDTHLHHIVTNKLRPPRPVEGMSVWLDKLMVSCWASDSARRPTMENVVEVLSAGGRKQKVEEQTNTKSAAASSDATSWAVKTMLFNNASLAATTSIKLPTDANTTTTALA